MYPELKIHKLKNPNLLQALQVSHVYLMIYDLWDAICIPVQKMPKWSMERLLNLKENTILHEEMVDEPIILFGYEICEPL